MDEKGKSAPDASSSTEGMGPEPRITPEILVIAIVLLTGTGSFGLGYVMGKEAAVGEDRGFKIENLGEVTGLSAAVGEAVPEVKSASIVSAPSAPVSLIPVPPGGAYVASKNGETYYLPSCGGVKNIKEENRIWFASKAEAEAEGYRPAKTCKGL